VMREARSLSKFVAQLLTTTISDVSIAEFHQHRQCFSGWLLSG